jgi:ferredoxin
MPVGGSEMLLEAEMIIAAIGQAPQAAAFDEGDLELQFCSNGTLEVDPQTGQTSHPKIFAGGDLTEARQRTVTWAMACGQRAAWAIDRALRGAEQADRRPPPPRPTAPPDGEWPGIEREDRAERQRPSELIPSRRASSYDEVVAPLTEEQARAEAARCLVCGLCGNCRSCIDLFGCPAFYVADERVQIDPAICTGCGVCAAFCPNNAISPKKEQQP